MATILVFPLQADPNFDLKLYTKYSIIKAVNWDVIPKNSSDLSKAFIQEVKNSYS